MKSASTIFYKILLVVFALLCITSCSDDDEPKVTHTVIVEVKSNTNETIWVYGIGKSPDSEVEINGNYQCALNTNGHEVYVRAKCYDFNTTITIKVWVDGVLMQEATGIKWVCTEPIVLK